MTAIVLIAYVLGAVLGLIAVRVHTFRAVWSRIIRTQILAVAFIISVTSVWALDSWADIAWPALLALAFALILAVGVLVTRPPNRIGRGVLLGWVGLSNTGFFVLPVASALVGAPGVIVAVLMDRVATPIWGVMTWSLRREAPLDQRAHTAWIDQAPLIGVAIGLVLHFTVPAPDWTDVLTAWAGPVFAMTGAAIFVGSALHPTQRISARGGVRKWLFMVSVRAVLIAPLVYFAPSEPVAVVSILAALSIPTFGPVQSSTMYGYSEPYVAASNRYGWIVGALGLVGALLMVHFA